MSINKYSTYLLIVAFLMLAPMVSAQTPTSRINPTREAKKMEIQQNTMTRLKTRAENEISRRITSLTTVMNKINVAKRLSAEQKSSLVGQVQQEINDLNALKVKINSDTEIETLRTDVQSIVKSFRVYALFIPEMQIVAHADMIMDLADQLSALTSQLQSLISTAQSSGKDVTQANAALIERNAKITDAISEAQKAINTVIPLKPENWPSNRTTLLSAREMLKTARLDLRTAHQDGKKIQQLTRVKPSESPKTTP